MKPLAFLSALALGAALSGQAYAQLGGGSGGLGESGLGDARAHNLPTSQGINNGYENGVYWGGYAGAPVYGYGYNSPPQSFERGPVYGYGYGPGPVVQGRSVYVAPYRHRRHRRHW
ncbi:MAG: hypothetical protein NVS2B5_07210 [Beijerinckiaceae bacterium]